MINSPDDDYRGIVETPSGVVRPINNKRGYIK